MASAKKLETETAVDPSWVEVESANLHQAHMVGGVGTVIQLNQAKLPGIKMYLTPQGLRCKHKNVEFVIPAANCTGFNLKK